MCHPAAVFLINVAVAASPAPTQQPPPAPPAPVATPAPASLSQLAWMAGHWRDETATDLSEEVWSAPAGDTMLGMWRWVSKGQARVIELLMLRQEGDGVALHFRHFDGRLHAWEDKNAPFVLALLHWAPDKAVFEGKSDKGGLLRLTYERDGESVLFATLEKDDQKPQTFRFRRAGTSAP
jgi:hypothetical protein